MVAVYYRHEKRWSQIFKELEVVTDAFVNVLPVSLPMLRRQCRIDDDVTDHDDILSNYCKTAQKLIEESCEITLQQRTYKLHLACFPTFDDYCILRFEYPPVSSITHVKYYDSEDVQQTLLSTLYEVWLNQNPPQILIRADRVPTLSAVRSKVVEIQFVAGSSADIPPQAKTCILEFVAFWFQNPEAYGRLPEKSAQGLALSSMLDSLRWRLYP